MPYNNHASPRRADELRRARQELLRWILQNEQQRNMRRWSAGTDPPDRPAPMTARSRRDR